MDSRDRQAAGAEPGKDDRPERGRQVAGPGLLSAGNAAVAHLLNGADQAGVAFDGASQAGNAAVTRLLAGGVQRAAAGPAAPTPPVEFAGSVAASDPGRPLPDGFRSDAEARFGVDFSGVRVHRDAAAAAAAEQVSARAFTIGSDVYFGRSGYDPDGGDGRRLLAHELTHVAQQGAAAGPPGRVSDPGEASEIAADRAAARFTAGEAVGVVGAAPPVVARAPDAGVPDAGGPTATVDVGGVQMSVVPATTRAQLREYAVSAGVGAARKMPGQAWSARSAYSATQSDISGMTPELESATAMVQGYDAVIGALEAEIADWDKYLGTFAQWAHGSAEAMLGFSEKRLVDERDRYGLTATETTGTMYTELGPVDTTDTSYGMAANPQTAAMAGAANQLAALLDPLQQAVHRLTLATPYDGPAFEFYIGGPEPDPKELAAAQEQVNQVLGEYAALYREKVTAFPILGSFADFDNLDEYAVKTTRGRLEEVARGAAGGDQTATLVSGDLHRKLANIATVRAALGSGELNIWAADNLVGRTKAEHGVAPGSLEDGIVNQQVAQDASDRMLHDLLIGALSFALGLIAAPLTGGTSLLAVGAGTAAAVGGVVLSINLALEHLQEHQLASAASATDFEKARSISSTDPSMIWLALDLIGVGLDIAAAVRAFAKLAPLARQAVRAGPDAAKPVLTALEFEAEAEKTGLGAPMRRAAEQQRSLTGGGGTHPTPPPAAAGAETAAETAAEVATGAGHAEKSLDELRALAKTDRDAAMALWQRYDDMADSELAVLAKKGDADARYFRQERIPPNDALEKILASDYRPPHQATAKLREGTEVLWEKELRSGGATAEQQKLNWRLRSLLTHTERKAIAEAPLKKGSTLYIDGQYDPCRFCRAAMREAAERTGAQIIYWWPGGRMVFP